MLKKLFGGKDNKDSRKDSKYQFVTKQPTTKTCPYCGHKLEKIPKRKKKCPNCENDIFVRRGKLFTAEEKVIRDWLSSYNINQLGITRNLFNKVRQELSDEFGSIASVNDTAWRTLNSINSPKKSFRDRELIYLAMADILKSEGKSTDEVLAQAHEMELLEGKAENEALAKKFRKELLEVKKLGSSGIHMVVKILTCNDDLVCNECRKLSEMTFTVDEALETMPIPNKCTNARCRCSYGFEFPPEN